MDTHKPLPDDKRPGHVLILSSVVFASFMWKLDSTIVNISLPTITKYFQTNTAVVSRIILAYLLASTTTLLFFGRLGDRIGHRRVFFWGYIIFTWSSLLCGVSWDIHSLVFFRFVQGAGCAMLVTSAYAIIPLFVPKKKIGSAFGLMSTSLALGLAIGAPVGALILTHLSWQWIFLINIPFGITAILVTKKAMGGSGEPQVKPPAEKSGFDWTGVLLSMLGLSLFVYAVNNAQNYGWGSPLLVVLLIVSIILLVLFVWREKRCKAPMLDLRIFKNKRFMLAAIAMFFGFFLLGGNFFLLPFYLELAKGIDTSTVGYLFMMYAFVVFVAAPFAGWLSDRITPGLLCTAAMFSGTLCCLVFALTLQTPGIVSATVFMVWMAFSMSFFASPNNSQAMQCAPSELQGVASGLFNMINTLGQMLGVLAFEAVFSQIIPEGKVILAAGGSGGGHEASLLFRGFRGVYFFAGFVCLLSMAFSFTLLIAGRRNKV